MLKFLIKSGITIQGIVLFYGYYNGNFKTPTLLKKDNTSDFKFNDFDKSFQENNIRSKPLPTIRENELQKLTKDDFDILIIGGGCSGAGVLLEAYQRGLKCALIEGNDFCSGTSSRSTKLIHGGIRYLQEAFSFSLGFVDKMALVFEALRERDFLLSSAPFMNRIIEIRFPYYNIFYLNYYFAGLVFYHFMYVVQNFPDISNIIPGPKINLNDKTVSFYEGQMFDARQGLLTILSTLRDVYDENGYYLKASTICNYLEFKEYIYEDKKIIGVKVFDKIKNNHFEVKAKQVVNCTGIFADSHFSKQDKLKDKLITSSQGVHIVLEKDSFETNTGKDSGYMIPETSDGRVLFILPYFNNKYILIGTTDNIIEKTGIPKVPDSDLAYLENEIKNNLGYISKLEPSSTWAGIRPLVRTPNGSKITKSISRGHIVRYDNESTLVSLLGGKWTTYRQMGEDVVKKIFNKNKELSENAHSRYTSKEAFRLPGGKYSDKFFHFNEEVEYFNQLKHYLAIKYDVGEAIADELVFKYGTIAGDILENGRIKKTNKVLFENILLSELLYCIQCEFVVKPNDFICRRTGLAFVNFKKAEKAIDIVADYMGKELKWSRQKLNEEINAAKENLKFMI
jgi:glycerol-3-phosphate dehydrogenase